MSQRTGILAGGNWIIDHVKIIDTWPAQDALANIVGGSDGSGGSPYNVLVDLAKMGAPIQLAGVGLVGEDADGHKIIADCSMYKINADAMQRTTAAPTSFTDVMTVQGTGRRTFFHARGANALLNSTHFDFTKTSARIFHLGYLLLLDGLDAPSATHGTVAAEVLARAQAAGMKTSIDVVSEDSDRFPKIVLPALKHVDVCVMNEFEAGVRERVVVHYPEGGCALGRDGAWDEHGSVRLPADYIVGAAGAGDAFTAGTLFGWHEGLPVREWLRHGVCAAAANLSDETCTGGIRPLAECLALGERYRFRG